MATCFYSTWLAIKQLKLQTRLIAKVELPFLLMKARSYSLRMGIYTVGKFNPVRLHSLPISEKDLKKPEGKVNEQEKWLKKDQLAYFEILKERSDNKKATEKSRKADQPTRPKEIYLEEKSVDNIQLSSDGNFITYRLTKSASNKNTIVPNYVTESGFTEDIPARTKVGILQNVSEIFIYDLKRDTVLSVKTDDLDGIFDVPEFMKNNSIPSKDSKDKKARGVSYTNLIWSPDGKE
jgi:hypothetical protein